MQRLTAVLVFVLAAVLALPAGAAPAPDIAEKAEKAEKADAPDRAKGRAAAGQRGENSIWWHDPAIQKALTLTDEQRGKMDVLLAAYRKKRPPERRTTAFHETLVQGTWKQARAESEKLSELAGATIRMRGELKIDVLSILSKEQHKELVDRFPRLIYKPWMRAMRGDQPR